MKTNNPYIIKDKGFTLIELLMAAALGVITTLMAGQVMVSQIESTQRIHRRDRVRSDWANANRFITTEINRSQYAVDGISNEEAENCGIEPEQARLALHFTKEQNLKPSIYYISMDDPAWEGILLKRCGPSFDQSGNYRRELENGIIINGLKDAERGYTQTITNKKLVDFEITLKDLDNTTYNVQGSARSRIQTILTRPGEQSICNQDDRNNINGIKINLTSGSDGFTPNQNRMQWTQKTNGNVLICGFGGGDTIHGGRGDDQIEAGGAEASELFGGDGNDRILGGAGNDTLQGGEGDDTLIGGLGDDLLEGGLGTNYYLPGIDQNNSFCEHDRIVGTRDGYDIIFFKENKDQYLQSNNCNSSSCRISKIQENNRKLVDIIEGNILVFKDQRVELLPGEDENLEPPAPGRCAVAVEIQAPPEDPRWEVLRATSEIAKGIIRSAKGIYKTDDRAASTLLVINKLQESIDSLPEICILNGPDHWVRGGYIWLAYRPKVNGTCQGRNRFRGSGSVSFWAHTDMSFTGFDIGSINKVGISSHCSNLRKKDFRSGREWDAC